MLLALDLSTKSTGYAIFDKDKLIESGCITASSTDTIKRIYKMIDEIKTICSKFNIDEIIAEEVHPENQYGVGNIRTQKVLMWLQGALEFFIHDKYDNKLSIQYVYPSEWRKVCGIKTGKNQKRSDLKPADVQFVKDTFNLDVNDDEADAICIGYFHIHKPQEKVITWGSLKT